MMCGIIHNKQLTVSEVLSYYSITHRAIFELRKVLYAQQIYFSIKYISKDYSTSHMYMP